MKKILLTFTLLIACNDFKSQIPALAWAKQMGGPSTDWAISITVDGTGNVYTTGFFQGTADFDPGLGTYTLASQGSRDVFISKLDASGNFIWVKRIGASSDESGHSIVVDGSNNVYVAGAFNGTVDFDPGAGVFNLAAVIGGAFVLKLDASGNFVWARHMAGNGDVNGVSIDLDVSGNVYTTGAFWATADFDPGVGTFTLSSAGGQDIFVSKLDASGNFVWAKQMGGTSLDEVQSIKIDGAGNVYICGNFLGTADFDPGAGVFNLVSSGVEDIFISKLDASGNFIWAKRLGGTWLDYSCSLAVDATGNVYTTGYFQATADFDPGIGTYTMTPFGWDDIFVSKLDASGNFVWAKQMGGVSQDKGYSIELDQTGNVYTTGFFNGPADFDPGVATFNLVGVDNIFVSKLDPSGNFVWAVQMGGTSSDIGHSVYVDALDNIYTTGYFAGTSDFDPGAGTYTLSSLSDNNSNIFVHKMAPCLFAPSQPGTINGLNTLCANTNLASYSITEVAGAIFYTWHLPVGWTGSSSSNSISATPGTTGIFTVTASNTCGTSQQQTLNVIVNATPTISVNSGSICSGNSFTLTPTGATTYTFQEGSTVVSPTANASYTVIGESSAGCISANYATSNITVSPLPTITVNSGSICSGQFFSMTPGGADSYTFQGGNSVVSPTITTSYTIVGTSSAGCISPNFATSNITVNLLPTITVNSGTICSGQSFSMTPGGADSYTFQGGNSVVSPTATAFYTVAGTSAAGCVSSSFVTSNVTVNTLPSITVNSGSICNGQSFTMTPSGAFTYTFQGGVAVVSPTTDASYTVTGTSSEGCVSSSPAVSNVTVNSLPTINVASTTTMLCVGQSATLTVSGASTYTFNHGGTGASIVVSPTLNSTYTISGTDANGCQNSSTFTQSVSVCSSIQVLSNTESEISVYPNPNMGIFTVKCLEPVTLNVYSNLGTCVLTIELNKGENKIDISSLASGLYLLKVNTTIIKVIKE